MGDVVNTAARAMAAASWGEILITGTSRRTLSGVLTVDRGRYSVKGKSVALHLHALKEVRQELPRRSVATPMIGRKTELAAVVEALKAAARDKGSVIGVRGDAGIGKSRLKQEAAFRAREMGIGVHEGHSYSFGGSSGGAVAALLKSALRLPEGAETAVALDTLNRAGRRLGLKRVDRHHLAEVLGHRFPDSCVATLPPKTARLNNLVALASFYRRLSREQPLLLVLEDMQWADAWTREVVRRLASGIATKPIVLLLLYRPGYEPPKTSHEIAMTELGPGAVRQLLRAHLGSVDGELELLVRQRADGNPFYVEELIRHMIECGILTASGDGHLLTRTPTAEDLPKGVESLIAARLDRLSAKTRRVSQLASVIGRNFLFHLLHRIDGNATAGAKELVGRALILEVATQPLEYSFKHALTRDVAYSSTLLAHRRRLHRAVAQAIDATVRKEHRQRFAATLALHWDRAGVPGKARRSYRDAARFAVSRHALEEAEMLFGRYLELVRRQCTESVSLRIDFATQVLEVEGRLEEAARELRRAVDDARRIHDPKGEARGLCHLGEVTKLLGKTSESRRAFDCAIAVANATGNTRLIALALRSAAGLHYQEGRIERALQLTEESVKISRRRADDSSLAISLSNMGAVWMRKGDLMKASDSYAGALDALREAGERSKEGLVLGNMAILNKIRGDYAEARRLYRKALGIARKIGDRGSQAYHLAGLGALAAAVGDTGEARTHLRAALRIHRKTGDLGAEATALGALASIDLNAGLLERSRRRYRQVRKIIRNQAEPVLWASVLLNLATIERYMGGNCDAVESLLTEAERLLSGTDASLERARVWCYRGFLALAMERPAREMIRKIRRVVEAADLQPTSILARELANLDRAQQDRDAGRPLIAGERPEDLGRGVLRWIAKKRPEAVPAEIAAQLPADRKPIGDR